MVKLAYTLIGKGKGRKRTLEEVLEIIKDKDAYFSSLNIEAKTPHKPFSEYE